MITSSARSRPRGGRGPRNFAYGIEADSKSTEKQLSKRMDYNWIWMNAWMSKWDWKFESFQTIFIRFEIRASSCASCTYIKLEIKKKYDKYRRQSDLSRLTWIYKYILNSIPLPGDPLATVDLERGEGRGGRIRRVCWYVRSAALIWFSNSVCLWGARVIWDGCCSVI